jgi:hypothetical protein
MYFSSELPYLRSKTKYTQKRKEERINALELELSSVEKLDEHRIKISFKRVKGRAGNIK